MIDASVIERLHNNAWRPTLHVCGEWISDGSWACRSTARPLNMTIRDESTDLSGLLAKLRGSVDLSFGPLVVMRTKPTILDGQSCYGDGGDVSTAGWAVLGCDGREEVVIGDLALPLLDGLELRRAVICADAMTWIAVRWAIVGMLDGQIEAIVMPRATEPEECK